MSTLPPNARSALRQLTAPTTTPRSMSSPSARLKAMHSLSSPMPAASPTTEMQALARETNLSRPPSSSLALPRSSASAASRFASSPRTEEVPFAGHPTLGTASWLYWNHPMALVAPRRSRSISNVGPIPVRFTPSQPGEQGVFGTMRQNDPVFGEAQDHAALARSAAAVSLTILIPIFPIRPSPPAIPSASFRCDRLRSLQHVSTVPQTTQVREYLAGTTQNSSTASLAQRAAAGADWHARMQFYNGEDPATGSAAGARIAWLVQAWCRCKWSDRSSSSRESRCFVPAVFTSLRRSRTTKSQKVFVGGRTIPVASGRFFLP